MKPQASDPLQGLHDIHLPAEPSWWPPAPGWWVLAAILLGVLIGLTIFLSRRALLRARRRRIIARIDELVAAYRPENACAFVADVSELLRRAALTWYPRERVAALSGEAWLRFLDDNGDGTGFRHGPGRILASGAYRRDCEVDPKALGELAKAWISMQLKHHGGR